MFKGKTVLVTGGTGFIGSEICRAFHHYGARVVFTYRGNQAMADTLGKEIPDAVAVPIDLRDVADIKDKISRLYEQVPVIDVLVNNAGISQIMPLPLVEEEDVDLIMDINLKGALFVTKNVIKGMIRNKTGAIVNLGSLAGNRMLDVPVTYAMTKAAISGFTQALAVELKRFGIRVNSVVPGLIDGGVGKGVPDSLRKDFIAHCAVGRAGKAREVAEVICFLASDKSSYVNGQNINVDGGI
jgi:NAD(P)-dependent dehydrogenase (short-subunit alcohol dehydrogenase family)